MRTVRVFISAAETSSDAHGAELLKELKKQTQSRGWELEAFGMGGPKLRAEGLNAVVDSGEMLVMGFSEILGRLVRIIRALGELQMAVKVSRPDIAVVIDYPDFHFRLARRIKKLGVPLVYYIPPKVWAWRKGRIHFLKATFKKILCILPFEKDFYEKENVPALYVGNPLVDELPKAMSQEEAKERLGIEIEKRVIVLLVGSRPHELKVHLAPMIKGAASAALALQKEKPGPVQIRISLPQGMGEKIAETAEALFLKLNVSQYGIELVISHGDAHLCMLASKGGVIKSGTSTLEAALLGLPHVVVYRPSWLSTFIIRKVIGYKKAVGLVNLVAGKQEDKKDLVTELISGDMTHGNIERELAKVLIDQRVRSRMKKGFAEISKKISPSFLNGPPSEVCATEILALIKDVQ